MSSLNILPIEIRIKTRIINSIHTVGYYCTNFYVYVLRIRRTVRAIIEN